MTCLWFGNGPALADVTDLVVTESGEDAVLTWSTGTPPWRILRSESPDFFNGNALLAQGLAVSSFTDVQALSCCTPSYYYLVLEDGQSNPPGFDLNAPRPIPFITSLTPDAGYPGDIVTIVGGNFDPTGSAMTVTFDGLYADILTLTATELTVVVPDGALTGDVQVCRVVCSNRVLFKVLVGPAFEDLSSIAFEPGTGSLWVADRGSTDTVYELDSAGNLLSRGTLNEALLGHPSTDDGNGRTYYCNSLNDINNIGRIEYIESATNVEVFFDNAGQSAGETFPVRCEGIAADDLIPEMVYFLDGRENTIHRIFRDSFAHDTLYGGQPFSFNRPAGARVDSGGNLYVSATTEIYKILPEEAGVELVAAGFTAAAGIDLSEETGIPLLLVADEATGEIWLVNGETGDKEMVGSGLDGPVGVAFSEDLVTGDLFYDVAEPTRIVRLPDPRAEFVVKQDVRVLMSKQGTTDSYPHQNQTQDGQIRVEVEVTDPVNPAGMTVYFRLIDPKDPSKYLNGSPDDNLPMSPAGTVTPSAIVDANGMASTTLTIDPQYGGNNYRIELSFDPPPNFKKIARSKTYTSWRRLYVEHDKMYKEGEFLSQTSGAGQPNPARVFVADPSTFSVGDDVHVLSGDSIATSEGEIRTVTALGADFVDLDAQLSLSYPEPLAPPSPPFPFSFLARRADDAFDVQPRINELDKAFKDAFTEWYLLPDGGFVPHWAFAEGANDVERATFIDTRTWTFFKHFDRASQTPMPFVNHVQLVSASRFKESPTVQDAVLGRAEHTNQGGLVAFNWSWVFSDTISLLAPSNVTNLHDQVTAHELGHQLNVNQGNPVGDGHDEEEHLDASGSCQPGTPGPNCCLMNPNASLMTSGVRGFHADGGAPSQDLLCIRTHVDDLNQDQCPVFP